MHLVIYFCGTQDKGEGFLAQRNYLTQENIKQLFVAGCEHKSVCGTVLFPDLKAFAIRFTQQAFRVVDERLEVNPHNLSTVGVKPEHSSPVFDEEAIESITLCGYSRGGVTCFEVAKELNKIAPHIPVNVVANQPVPGNSYQGPGTNAARVADLRHVHNIKNATIILGAYTGKHYKNRDQEGVGERKLLHRGFFSQIVPKLPRATQRDLIVLPRENHHQNLYNSPDGSEHMHLQIATYLNKSNNSLIDDYLVEVKKQKAQEQYHLYEGTPALFAQPEKLQRFFGLSKHEAYRYVDPLHPMAKLRSGYTLGEEETLQDWWQKHDKKTSVRESSLTKDLVDAIKITDRADPQAVKNLFALADRWLLHKSNKSSSRYYQVEALRHNLEFALTHKLEVPASELVIINRENMQQSHYFYQQWQKLCQDSPPKTAASKALDFAFKKHAVAMPSRENDQMLLSAVQRWLEAKSAGRSTRWDAVNRLAEQLSELVNKGYPQPESLASNNNSANAP